MLLRVRHIQMQKETDIPDDQLPACMNPRLMQEDHALLQSSLHDYIRRNDNTLLSSKYILNICMFHYQLRNIDIFTYDDKSCSPYKYGMAVNGRTASHLYFSFQTAIVVSNAAINLN